MQKGEIILKWVEKTSFRLLFNLPISSLALAKRSVGNVMRLFKWLKILWAPLRQAVCSASSPYLLLANGSAPLSNKSFVVSNLWFDRKLKHHWNRTKRIKMTLTQLLGKLTTQMCHCAKRTCALVWHNVVQFYFEYLWHSHQRLCLSNTNTIRPIVRC